MRENTAYMLHNPDWYKPSFDRVNTRFNSKFTIQTGISKGIWKSIIDDNLHLN